MIYEEKNTLSKEVCNDMISWFDNKITSGDYGHNYMNVSNEGAANRVPSKKASASFFNK